MPAFRRPSLRQLQLFAKYHLRRRTMDHPAPPEDDLGLEPFDFDLAAYADRIRSFAGRFDVEQLSELDYRGEAHPMFRIGHRPAKARAKLLVLAGVHGNEHAGIVAIPSLLESLPQGPLAGALAVEIVTPVNPVGARHGSRFNAEGFDINRDFRVFETREARAVRRVYRAFRPHLVLSLHEGPQDAGTFMFTNESTRAGLALGVLARLRDQGVPLATRDYLGRTLSPAGYAPQTRALKLAHLAWDKVLEIRTVSEWAAADGIPEITLETPWRDPDREARVLAQRATIEAVAAELLGYGRA